MLLTAAGLYAQNSNELTCDKVFDFFDVMPEFPGGQDAMYSYFCEHIEYPLKAKENGIQGIVYIQFIVNTAGLIKDAKVIRGIDPDCDEEALRIVSNMPAWKPAQLNGIAVCVSLTLPIRFYLAIEENVK